MSRLQSGRVQSYLRVIGVALVVLVLLLIWGCRAYERLPLLTILTFVPLVGALVVVGLGAGAEEARALARARLQPGGARRWHWCCGAGSTPPPATFSLRSGTPGFPRWASSITSAWTGWAC